MPWPFGRKTLRRVAYPASAGTWRASRPGKLRLPPSDPIETFFAWKTVGIDANGVAPTAVFGASGTATAQIGPSGYGMSWALDQASVSTSVGLLDVAEASLYVGPQPTPDAQVAANLAGGGAQFGLGGVGLVPGSFVWAVWTGGTPGATGQLKVTGTATVLV